MLPILATLATGRTHGSAPTKPPLLNDRTTCYSAIYFSQTAFRSIAFEIQERWKFRAKQLMHPNRRALSGRNSFASYWGNLCSQMIASAVMDFHVLNYQE